MVYKHWSFVFFATAVILNLLVAYFAIKTTNYIGYDHHIFVFGLKSYFFATVGTILGVLSFIKKEKNDYKKYIGLMGNGILLISSIIANLI
ncbi:hypothetical protein [Winogradskyella sp. PE311]|uniref:hypothetical protein n=1 Tax=Winogradskyella sp. PE311 TaxID=3366943 RepID=UPI00397FCB70